MNNISARDMTARQYHEFMLASESDRGTRAMFQQAVLSRLSPGASIFDFGAGSGIDAKAYGEHGHRVHAYDSSTEMQETFSDYCRSEMATGRIKLVSLPFGEFLKQDRIGDDRLDAITANFAVLNLIPGHAPLFRAFDRWLSPNGFILIGVISPYHLTDARYAWWWRHLGELVFRGQYDLRTGDDLSHRFGVSALKRAAAPYFRLEGLVRSAPRKVPARNLASPASETDLCGPLFLCTHRFIFLLFRRH
ncbi:MAG TPA: methyltransferase domain-containing protein [Micropepsaceae bacterium]|nr:methyltransferase domain-containing protein [Micropepsaceae bacterium]